MEASSHTAEGGTEIVRWYMEAVDYLRSGSDGQTRAALFLVRGRSY